MILNTLFWLSVEELLKALEPIIKVLRLVDSDTKPNMAYLYGTLLEAKTTITKIFVGDASSYHPILDILNK